MRETPDIKAKNHFAEGTRKIGCGKKASGEEYQILDSIIIMQDMGVCEETVQYGAVQKPEDDWH